MPTEYVSDWENLYGRKVPSDGSIHGEVAVETQPVEAKVITAPEPVKPSKKTAEVK